jgi:hypothetical protein
MTATIDESVDAEVSPASEDSTMCTNDFFEWHHSEMRRAARRAYWVGRTLHRATAFRVSLARFAGDVACGLSSPRFLAFIATRQTPSIRWTMSA